MPAVRIIEQVETILLDVRQRYPRFNVPSRISIVSAFHCFKTNHRFRHEDQLQSNIKIYIDSLKCLASKLNFNIIDMLVTWESSRKRQNASVLWLSQHHRRFDHESSWSIDDISIDDYDRSCFRCTTRVTETEATSIIKTSLESQVKWIHTWIIWYPTDFDEISHRLMCKTTFSNEKNHEKLVAKWCPGKLWGFIGLDRIGCYNVYDGFLVVTCNVKP